jgi:predicted amidohydrolase YtcJ
MAFCNLPGGSVPERRSGGVKWFMRDRRLRAARWVLPVAIAMTAACRQEPDAGPAAGEAAAPIHTQATLITNARIYTMDAGDTVIASGALAFSSAGEILGIGEQGPMAEAFPDADRIDLEGRAVLPGLIDSHGHLYGLALTYTQADLVGAASKAEVLERLRRFAATLSESDWLLGHGWDQNDWPEPVFPSRADLDAEFPDRPVWLVRIDGHAGWANSAALAQADRDLSGDWQPEGGAILRDAEGQASGILIDKAMNLVEGLVPPLSDPLVEAALERAVKTLVGLGLTGVHDPGVDRDVVDRYRAMIAAGAMPLRVYAMADGVNPTLDWLCESGPLADPSRRLFMRSVKLFADGALGSRGAALLDDYSDDPGNNGLLFSTDEALREQMRRVLSCGLQLGVHAIGDRANRQVLDAYAALLPEFPGNPGRHRIEHAQVVHPADLPRFAELGVIAAMQPIHATSDMYWAGERLGPARLAGAYAWRSLLDGGAKLAFGSDFPVEAVNPMLGIYAAVTRQDLDGWPEGGWQADERLDRADAVRALTLDAAYAAFMEDDTGSLEVGKRADFIVLDRDLMRVPADEIPGVSVLQTWVDGQQVFAR